MPSFLLTYSAWIGGCFLICVSPEVSCLTERRQANAIGSQVQGARQWRRLYLGAGRALATYDKMLTLPDKGPWLTNHHHLPALSSLPGAQSSSGTLWKRLNNIHPHPPGRTRRGYVKLRKPAEGGARVVKGDPASGRGVIHYCHS